MAGTAGSSPESRNFSVGFSLQPSYAVAAVIFEAAGEKPEIYTVTHRDSDEYRDVMKNLSLPSSQHLALVKNTELGKGPGFFSSSSTDIP
jgi:hypothetical protein